MPIAIALILLATFFLQVNNIDWETYGYAEIEIKEAAESYAKGNFINNYYLFDTPPFGKYIFAVASVGASETALRMVSVIFGLLAVLATFFLGKKLYGNNAGLLAAAISGFSMIHIQFSRYAQLETTLSLFLILMVYFLWDTMHDGKRYAYIFLGVSIGLALATKFTSVIFLTAVIVYAIYTRHIRASIRPNFSLIINNKILKAIIISAVAFLAVWPFGFVRLHAEANISVDYGNEVRDQQVSADIPIILLSFSRRIFASAGAPTEGTLSVPVLNYFLLYIVKESILIIPLIAAGIYFMLKRPLKPDKMILIFLATFFILVSAQQTYVSYRHLVPAIPLLSIAASRWVVCIKKQRILIGAIAAVLFIQAWLAGPSYALHFNPLKEPFGIPDSELRFNEGMREAIGYIKENCTSTYASDYYRVMAEPYYEKIHSSPPGDCVIKGNANDMFDADSYIQKNNCALAKAVSKNDISLIEIYRC